MSNSSSPRARYYALLDDLKALENADRPYLTDEGVDRENVNPSLAEGSDEYFVEMYRQAASAAGYRAEDYGFNINQLLGRVIY